MADTIRKIIIETITRMLARREHSRHELMTKLSLREFSEQDTMPIIEEFADANVQSDERYAEMRVRSCASRGLGPRRISAELAQHNIDLSQAERAMSEAEIDWYELAKAVKIKKFGDAAETDFKLRQKQMQFMNYRGFTQPQIQYAVGEQ